MSRKFSIPYNHDVNLLTRLCEEFPDKIDNIYEVFFPIENEIANTGRVIEQKGYRQEIERIFEDAKKYNIHTNILLNAGCMADQVISDSFLPKLVDYLKSLVNDYGLNMITISDFYIAAKVKEKIPELEIECSSVAYVDSVNKAMYWESIGVDIMVIPHDFTKHMDFIKDLKSNLKKMKLKLMINHHCKNYCPMFTSHNNIEGHGDAGKKYMELCETFSKPWRIYGSGYVTPRKLAVYDDYIDVYKILDRYESTQRIIERFGAYTLDERYTQRIERMNSKIPDEVFDKVLYCNKICNSCNFCEQYYNNTTLQLFL